MAHPLFHLARRLEKRRQDHRSQQALRKAQADPHLARDIGLPFRPRPKLDVNQW